MSESTHETEVTIKNPEGLHMRPAMQFVDMANTFASSISVSNGDVSVDAKSIMQMTMLAATCGTRLIIQAKGQDARQAADALYELIECEFSDDSAPVSD
ncbi:MAG: HPr family phosphocarrier protein [Planctomycetota bacterium]|jgi:phosphotransferase system HPr (HPr) family protein